MIREGLSLKQLRALQAVSESGTISGAANQLSLTTPAVHTQLKNLENLLDIEVLDRSAPGHMTLTTAGAVLEDMAKRIEAVLDLGLRDIAALKSGSAGHVALGVVSTGKYFAPSLVARLMDLHPGIRIALKIGNRGEVIKWLRDGNIRLAIMGRPPREPILESEVVGRHPHVIVARPDHPFAGVGAVPQEAFENETFVVREEGSGTRILLNRYLDRIGGGHIYRTIEMDSNETIKQAVMAGLGIALLSEHTLIEELRSNRLVRLYAEGVPIYRQWYLLRPAAFRPTPSEEKVRQSISDMKGDFLPTL